MWLGGELGLAYERIDCGSQLGGLDDSSFLAMNPNGCIPVTDDDDGTTMWESHSIIRYLSARYASNVLIEILILYWAIASKFEFPFDALNRNLKTDNGPEQLSLEIFRQLAGAQATDLACRAHRY
jgi:glutathione S-transferase